LQTGVSVSGASVEEAAADEIEIEELDERARGKTIEEFLLMETALVKIRREKCFGEIELAAAGWIDRPSVEVSPVGEVVVDEASEGAGEERVAIAMALEVILDRLRVAGDTAGAKERLGILRTEAGEGYAKNAGDGLARRVEEHARNQPGGDDQFGGRGGSEGAEQVIVFGTYGGAGVAV